jgi:CelD/BcsL family acetyltransferase involved in cellulose biosynthesis
VKLHFEIVNEFEDIKREEWDSLLSLCPSATIFQTHQWVSAWHQVYGINKKIRIVLGLENDRLVLILPFYIEKQIKLVSPITVCSFLGDSRSDYHSLICEHDKITYFFEAIEFLRENFFPNAVYKLHHLVPTQGSAILSESMPDKCLSAVVRDEKSYCIDFADGYQLYRSKTLKYLGKKLEGQGQLQFKSYQQGDVILDRIDNFFKLHISQWRQTNTPSLFNSTKNTDFYCSLVKEMSICNLLHYSELNLNDCLIAAHFGFIFRDRFYYYKPAYNIAYKYFSPGDLLLTFLIEEMIERRLAYFDFLRGDEPYKKKYSNMETSINSYFYYTGKLAYIFKYAKRTKDWLLNVFTE